MEVKKKSWPENFNKILSGEKNTDIRLADFKLNKGDVLVFEEYNPKTKEYTGRVIKKKIKNIAKFNPAEIYPSEDIKKFGFWEIELE